VPKVILSTLAHFSSLVTLVTALTSMFSDLHGGVWWSIRFHGEMKRTDE